MSASSPQPIVSSARGGADHGLRASEAEREDTVAMLHRALGAGRLDLAEADTRVAARYRPTGVQRRIAALFVAVALVWISSCALLGAASVAA
jgi:hypothetical protein